MAAKSIALTILLCCTPLLHSVIAEEEKVQDIALKKLQAQKDKVFEWAWKMTHESEQDLINYIAEVRLGYGSVFSERTNFEFDQIGESYRFIAGLMRSRKDVISCMENQTKVAQEEKETFYMEKFYRAIRDDQYNSNVKEMDRLFKWDYERKDVLDNYVKFYDEAVKKIKNTENPEEIQQILDDLQPKADLVIARSKNTISEVRKIQMAVLTNSDKRMDDLRKYCREGAENLTGALQNCFLVKSPFYNIRKIMNTILV